MTSIQSNTKQLSGDKWSTREQLCLVSAISDNSEPNWNLISCSLKAVCDVPGQSRPSDWFSQTNCVAQYEQLLEEVNNKACSSAAAKCPVQMMLRTLTEERVQELRTDIRKEQEEYAKLYTEIRALQADCLNDEQLLQMWLDIEKKQEMQRIEEMKLENRLREREEKKNELKKAWHPTAIILNPGTLSQLDQITSASATNTITTKLDAETILSSSKTNAYNTSNNATSPLLSSLLKSNQHIGGNNNGASPGNTSSIRTAAPTITTLLTGGSIANTNQPAIIPSHDDAIQLLTRPITGPPLENISTTQNLLSPSQSAPTISMLLEKTKSHLNSVASAASAAIKPNQPVPNTITINVTDNSVSSTDVNNEPIPMDIEEDVAPIKICERAPSAVTISDDNSNDNNNLNDTNGINSNRKDNTDKTDPNEEEQLLEVFKNIGNIDDLDIVDVAAVINEESVNEEEQRAKEVKEEEGEVSFLKAIIDAEAEKSKDESEGTIKSTSIPTELIVNNTSTIKATANEVELKEEETKDDTNVVESQVVKMVKNPMKISNGINNEIEEKSTIKNETATKVEVISSDDSNDNLPLSTVATITSITKEHTTNMNNANSVLDIDRNLFLMESDKVTNMKNESNQERNETELNHNDGVSGSSGDTEVGGNDDSSLKNETLKADKKDISILDMTEIKECYEIPTTMNCNDDQEQKIVLVSENSESKENFGATAVQSSDLKDLLKQDENKDKEYDSDIITIPKKLKNNENKVESKVMNCVKALSETERDAPTQHNIDEKSIVIAGVVQAEAESKVNDIKVNVRKHISAPIITMTDTDEDSSTTDASTNTRKDEKASSTVSKLKRRSGNDVKKTDNMPTPPPTSMVTPTSTVPNTQTLARSSTLRKLRERDRSESPMIDDDTNTTNTSDQSTSQRLRRRYSTPMNDSMPNSPASSDREERELRASKKSLLSIFNILNSNKYAVMIQRLFSEESFTSKLEKICLLKMDLQTIKKNIESGQIRTTLELQRDILLMCQNAQMVVGKNSNNYKIILAFQHKCESIREFMRNNIEVNQDKKINKSNTISSRSSTTSKSRSGSRKSLRIS